MTTVSTNFVSLDGSLEGGVNGPGTDAIWLNADDDITGYDQSEFNQAGGLETATTYSGPGPDGDWFTADDQRSNQIVHLPFPDEFWANNFGIAL